MSGDDYRWHYDYARLAWDLGFTFQTLRAKPSLDKNIGHIDIEQVIRERDVATIERYIGTVIEFNLDNDQTSVLDPTFVKVFRLSQLSVQYLVFCKKYLDNTVVLIKKEFTKNNEESKNLKRYVEELHQEVANSRKQIKELKSALSCQIASTQNVPIHQCNECPKAFSTEEYLVAHIKRRHQGGTSTSFQAETDKLQLEIKELKERLNNTEKFIHSDEPNNLQQDSNFSTKNNSTENLLLKDLQQKFELLKNHVENELRILQTQKFDQDKYEQWFETFLKKLEHTHGGKETKTVNEKLGENAAGDGKPLEQDKKNNVVIVKPKENYKDMDEVLKNDGATQTDLIASQESTVCKNCHGRKPPTFEKIQVEESKGLIPSPDSDGENIQHNLRGKADNHLEVFQKMLENKVTGSIEKLENQMQDFWNKMNEVENQKVQTTNPIVDIHQTNNSKSNTSIESIEVMPKPRKKILTKEAFKPTIPKPNKTLTKIKPKPREIIKTTHIKLPNPPVVETITLKEAGINFKSNSESESEISEESESSESSDEESDDNKQHKITPATVKPSNTSTLGQRSLTSLKEAAFTPEVLQGLQKEIENVLNSRLEEIGISPEWSSLPIRSYQRALNIVTHQANLIQKNITNYLHIRGQILNDVDQQVVARKKDITPQKRSKLKNLFNNIRNKATIIAQNEKAFKKPVAVKGTLTKRMHSQKNKKEKTYTPEKERNTKEDQPKSIQQKMYEIGTESDTSSAINDKKNNHLNITDQTQKAYFNVIQELNSKSKIEDLEIPEAIQEEKHPEKMKIENNDDDDSNSENKIEIHAKGVLKNYPSVGSLQKKKVLFDLESSLSDNKEPPKPAIAAKAVNEGSTTSIASSVFDDPKSDLIQKNPEKKKPNELSDISDWDISDILD